MLCKEFEALTPKERTEFIGEIVHACMNDSQLFAKGDAIRKAGRMRGLFEGVIINPAPPIDKETNRD